MSATNFLDNCYSGLSSVTGQLYFFPYSSANKILAGSRTRQNYNTMNNTFGNDPSLEFATSMLSAVEGQNYANSLTFLLTPILLPLTIVTFVLALAIDIAALLTKLITYPIASGFDAIPSF